VLIDRTTIFGNPFSIGRHGNRDDVIKRFKRYFTRRVKYDVKFRNTVRKLAGKTLLCWCHPMECHGDEFQKPWATTQEELSLRFDYAYGKITLKQFERRYEKLKRQGKIIRNGKMIQ